MGLINHNNYTFNNGLECKDTYIAISENCVKITKIVITDDNSDNSTAYKISYHYNIYYNKNKRDDGLIPIDIIYQTFNVVYNDLIDTNIYNLCYNNLKQTFTNTTDI